MRLGSLPKEAGDILFSLFQPTAKVAPLFDVLVACLKHAGGWRRAAAIAWALISGFRALVLTGALAAAAAAWLLDRYAGIGGIAFGVLLTALGLAAGVLAAA